MLKGSNDLMAVSYLTDTKEVFDYLSEEDKQKMILMPKKSDLKEWILTWSSVKPNKELDEKASYTFHAVKRVAVELLLQMRNSSCQERNFSLNASSDLPSKYLSTTFDANVIKSFSKNQTIFKNHPIEVDYNRYWLNNI